MADKGRTLLIVEDDPALQKQMRWSFDDYEVVLASDRESALAQIKLDGDKVGELWVLPTKVQDKNSQHQEFLGLLKADATRKDAPFKMFESQIPQLPSLARALQYNEIALPYADKYGDSAKTMEGFAFEFVRRIADAQRR